MVNAIGRLNEILTVPSEDQAFDEWLKPDSAAAFLKENARQTELVVYASAQFAFIHSILVPTALLSPPDIDDLMCWSCNPSSSWRLNVTLSEPRSVSISPPLESTGTKTLDRGEQLIFSRRFEGLPGTKRYYEVLQKFAHIFDLLSSQREMPTAGSIVMEMSKMLYALSNFLAGAKTLLELPSRWTVISWMNTLP